MPLADDTAQLPADPVSGRTPPPPSLLLGVAYAEALRGLSEGGIPIGAALFAGNGTLLGSGRNRRVQQADPSLHAETDAFRAAGRLRDYRNTIMVSTLAPCWYCSGLIRQFGIGTLIVGEARTLPGGLDWLADHGVRVSVLDDARCIELMTQFVADQPALWAEDIGEPAH
jgi:cytosine/creatinine deaminase